ncbi:MAG TPA: electron transfer flavoprotein subunit alpha/FixB family protein [Thermomicrobiales bacterium]|jgi:electron transfer flavoprotein alpha subunit|nr:electron transfer flavoprotein subunit alpha/FixB family protein [Chloroflexota bacterium]HBY45243.1 electron transfer flavoprotein subunit alpha/FixB family protein [Chloroflexota bacterium]HCG28890.1 electron transfer flavoprotein subunit alpha/FixB family protein [Chloroflexota bacterium]HQZ91162.1 electron transfer flavoprotein subunit alpha/FixB family protein [Thermomicrobiales bacterium]HRA32936.1 electron transfer flavoprotein subunit alpha/FixB family protein [Thermomicrobiales bact
MTEKRVWVWTEVTDGAVHRQSLELLTPARALGTAEAVVFGPAGSDALTSIGNHGATVIHHGDDPRYAEYLAEPHAATLAAMIASDPPDLILFSSTPSARDLVSRLAAKLNVGVIANATDVRYDGDDLRVTVPWGAETTGTVTLRNSQPHLVQIRPKAFAAEEVGGQADVRPVGIAIEERTLRTKVIETVVEASEGPNLEDASIIVSGGRGLGQPENYALVEDLAKTLGGAPGATRAIVDAGWVPYSHQVGQTGKTVKPTLYVACGISGAIQHIAGMKGSKYIIAINRDPDAPIFELADLGVVGDVMTIVPKLTEQLRRG